MPGVAVNFNAGSSSDPGGAITRLRLELRRRRHRSWAQLQPRVFQARHLHRDADRDRKPRARDEHQPHRRGPSARRLSARLSAGAVRSSPPCSSSGVDGQRLHEHGRQGELRGHDARAAGQAEAQARQARRQGKDEHDLAELAPSASRPAPTRLSLKLSAAGAAKLRAAGKPVVLTVQMTLTDVYGRKVGRSVKVTVTR